MKVLAAEQPLSLQAHPNRAQAEAGYAREQLLAVPRDAPYRNYRDGWPKPELLCALQPTEALCGFREPKETYELFARLGVASALRLVEPLRDGTAESLAVVFRRLLQLGRTTFARGVVEDLLTVAGSPPDDDRELAAFGQTAVEIAQFYPADPGILAALMMNRLAFGPYDAIFLPPGDLHAYLRGGGIEIMANSDNVLRGGLTPKHIAVDELIDVLEFAPSCPSPGPRPGAEAGCLRVPDAGRGVRPLADRARPGRGTSAARRRLRSGRAGGERLGSAGDHGRHHRSRARTVRVRLRRRAGDVHRPRRAVRRRPRPALKAGGSLPPASVRFPLHPLAWRNR